MWTIKKIVQQCKKCPIHVIQLLIPRHSIAQQTVSWDLYGDGHNLSLFEVCKTYPRNLWLLFKQMLLMLEI